MFLESQHKQRIMDLEAEPRTIKGTQGCKRLRKRGLIPVNIYGHKKENLILSVPEKKFLYYFNQGHRIMQLNFSGKKETGMLKEVQYDAFGNKILHVDFARISRKEKVQMQVQIKIVGVAKGVSSGGILNHIHKELEMEGPAIDIPEEIEVHIADLAIGDSIKVKDIEIPSGCKLLNVNPNEIVLVITERKVTEELEEKEPTEGEEAEEPKVMGKETDKPDSLSGDNPGGKK